MFLRKSRWCGRVLLAAASLAGLGMATAACAQDYPQRPITLIYPYPSGPTDGPWRLMAEQAGKALGQPVIVENKAGAGGRISVLDVSTAKPDGYLIGAVIDSVLTVVPMASDTFKLQPGRDYTPVQQTVTTYPVAAVSSEAPFRDMRELIAYARANPGKVNYGSAGVGGSLHLNWERVAEATGTSLTHIPYRGTAQAFPDLLSGKIAVFMSTPNAFKPYVDNGKLRWLFIAGPQRSQDYPDIPTLREAGVALDFPTWLGVVAPPNLPPAILSRLNAGLNEAITAPAVKKAFLFNGLLTVGGSPEAFTAAIRKANDDYGPVVRRLGFKLD